MHTNTIDGTTGNSTAIDVELGGVAPPSIRDNRSMLEFGTDDDEEEEEKPLVKAIFALVLLLAVTGITGVTAEFLVSSINGVTESTSMSPEFVGMILLPIVGNGELFLVAPDDFGGLRGTDSCSCPVPEHVCAVTVSIKDKLDLSLSIAVGSTIQVALGILPLLVLIGWAMGQPMSLFFDAFQM
jgi:Ca2+:H+ antiporter